MHALFLGWLGGIVGRVRTLRVARHAAGQLEPRKVVGTIPVAAPLPYVAGDIVEAVGVRWELCDRRDAFEAVLARVAALQREPALVNVRLKFSARLLLVAPCIQAAGHSAARSELPLRFRGQAFARPLR